METWASVEEPDDFETGVEVQRVTPLANAFCLGNGSAGLDSACLLRLYS